MEKRAFIAVGLSIAVFYIFSMVFGPDKKQVQTVPQPVTTTPAGSTQNRPNEQVAIQHNAATEKVILPAAAQKDIKVETDLYTVVFSSRGAGLKSMTLKKYREQNSTNAPNVVLGNNADPALLNFSTRATGFNLADSAIYSADAEEVKLNGSDSKQVAFTVVAPQGYTIRKVYTFKANSYVITQDTQVINNSVAPLVGSIQSIMTYPAEPKVKDNRFDTAGSYLYSDASLKSDKAKDVAGAAKKYDKSVLWAGFADKYFLSAILSDKNSIASVDIKKNAAGFLESTISSPQLTVNPGTTTSVTYHLFVGPKDLDVLKAQGNMLEQSLDLGWFAAIAKPLMYTLKFFHRFVGNYGIAIIIITVILKAFFFPLTHKSYKSMKGMQKIQPEMAKLREKYKNDRDAMNKAVMELYRDHKVNPLGGCLPMVVQIPVFFALYKSLMFSIELRHAPFLLWITDLADKDPYYVTPVIMGISMFVQQKMTPSNMDPVQQKMMLALPVVFTFMFLSFPSGLVLYWLVNNILTIAQQWYINKSVE